MAESPTDILTNILTPLAAGNPVDTIKMLTDWDKKNSAHSKMKNRMKSEVVNKLTQECFTVTEYQTILQIVKNNKTFTNRNKSWKQFNESFRPHLFHTKPAVGRANFFLVGGRDKDRFGCIHAVTAKVSDNGKGEREILVPSSQALVIQAVTLTFNAVEHYLESKGLDPKGLSRFNNHSISVQVGKLGQVYEGASLGLATSVAVLSAFLKHPVPGNLAFTGEVGITGEIERINGLDKKLEIAGYKEMKKVFIPADNKLPDDIDPRIDVSRQSSLNDIFGMVFDENEIKELVKVFNNKVQDTAKYSEDIFLQREKQRMLISIIGNRDPYGTPMGRPDEQSEGAVLTAFRRLQPGAVCLLAGKEKHIKKNAEKTKKILQQITTGDPRKIIIKSVEITNPTDYDQIYVSLSSALGGVKDLISNSEVFLSMSSGSSQIHSVLVHLLQTKEIKAYPIQVLEPRYAETWEDRVRIVRSKHLGIGCH